MGRGLATLIQRELETVLGAELDVNLLPEIESHLRSRERQVDDRERRLAEREQSVTRRERFLASADQFTASFRRKGVGRNERCPCGSGIKYKRCHGSPLASEDRTAEVTAPPVDA